METPFPQGLPRRRPIPPSPPASPGTANPTFEKLVGKWLRPDGGYILDIRQLRSPRLNEMLLVNHETGCRGASTSSCRRQSISPDLPSITPTTQVAAVLGRLTDESLDRRHAAAQPLLAMGLAIEPQVGWAFQQPARLTSARGGPVRS